jgi:4-hydroxy-tetrahydrodipicolinate synthase
VNSLSKLCDRLVADGIAGLLPLGTTGEASSLTTEERHLVVETCAKAVAGSNTQLVIGVGTNSTATTIEHMKEVADFHPDGLLVVTPYYVKPSEEGILAHFAAVADVADQMSSDVMLYNIPGRTAKEVSTAGLLKAAQHSRIAGVKQSLGSITDATMQLLAEAPDDFSVMSGDDGLAAALCLMGGKGAVAASAHLATSSWVQMVDAAIAGDAHTTRELQKKLVGIVQAGFAEPNPVVFKGALAAMGEIESGFVRLPQLPASSDAITKLISAAKSV